MLRGAILNFFPKILSGETLCNVSSIFPPKVYRGKYIEGTFFVTLFYQLIEFSLTN